VVISPPFRWQERYNSSDISVENRMDRPLDPHILRELEKFSDFRRAYEEKGMGIDEFDAFGPTARTLRQFIKATTDLIGQIRDVMLPDPDA